MKRVLLLLLLGLSALSVQAQSPNKYGWVYPAFPTGYGWVMPRVSPTASLSQDMGVTEITIRYSRPAAKGRTIWGDLVPYNQVWRAGANETTVISFSTDVEIENQPLAAGTYGLFVIPTPESWTLIFSNKPHQWGAFSYNEQTDDALRVVTIPEPAEHMERLQYTIPLVSDSTAQVVLHWGTLKAPLTISTEVYEEARTLANTSFDWRAGYFAADYFYQEGVFLEEALKWINVALALEDSASSLLLKARILARMERFDEAISTAEAAKAKGNPRMQQAADDLIATWNAAQN